MVIPCFKMLSPNNRYQGLFLFPSQPAIDGAVWFPFSSLLTYVLRFYRLNPDKFVPNLFCMVGCIEKFNRQFGVKLTHYDINYIHNCCSNPSSGYYIKVHRGQLTQISCLLSSIKNSQEEFLNVTGNWYAEEISYLASKVVDPRDCCISFLYIYIFYLFI